MVTEKVVESGRWVNLENLKSHHRVTEDSEKIQDRKQDLQRISSVFATKRE
jgi:hypothetical protein